MNLRALPQVDAVLRDVAELAPLGPHVARWIARQQIDAARQRMLDGAEPGDVLATVAAAARALTDRRVRRVINATGVVLHTNLGRAPLSDDAIAAVVDAAGAAAIELDVTTGERARRAPVASTLVAALCDAQDALIVNNNAGALLLMLAALAKGHEVVVSRGELIEIGGEFRLPDVMEASGALLHEVGTTNRTHARDYQSAMNAQTALVLKVHPSNYEVVGFTAAPSTAELAAIAHGAGVPLAYDTGSGLLRPDDRVADEPDAASALAAGADLVCFSGDKLLGGPQAGVIAGRADLVERCRRHPIARAVRADKLSLAALEATLWHHATGEPTPVQQMLDADVAARARALADAIGGSTIEGSSVTGGGSLPGRTIATTLVRVAADKPHALAARLRANDPPIIARIEAGAIVLDLRTVPPDQDAAIAAAF
jgi:L-seryl-tRNA(Ser) seleniumtransferase